MGGRVGGGKPQQVILDMFKIQVPPIGNPPQEGRKKLIKSFFNWLNWKKLPLGFAQKIKSRPPFFVKVIALGLGGFEKKIWVFKNRKINIKIPPFQNSSPKAPKFGDFYSFPKKLMKKATRIKLNFPPPRSQIGVF